VSPEQVPVAADVARRHDADVVIGFGGGVVFGNLENEVVDAEPEMTMRSTMKVTMKAMCPMATDRLHRRAHRRPHRRQEKIMHAVCAVQSGEQVP
jgi:hypothetical protein